MPRLTRREGLFAAACLCCLPRSPHAAPIGLRAVAPGLYVRAGLQENADKANADAIANLSVIVGERSVAVIDPGGSLADGQSLRRAIRQITPKPISHVVLTHVHQDHMFGAGAFHDDTPLFVGHHNLPQEIDARGDFYRVGLVRLLGEAAAGEAVKPSILVADTAEIDLGHRVLKLTAHPPAHTRCDLSVVDTETGTWLSADLVFAERVPTLDGDLAGWIAQLAARQNTKLQLIPGHGSPTQDARPPIAVLLRYLRALHDETQAAMARGVAIEDAPAQVAQAERARWLLFDDYHERNVYEAYRKLEWQ